MYRVIIQKDKADHYLTTELLIVPLADCLPHGDEVAPHEPKEFRTIEGATSAYYGINSGLPGFVYDIETRVKYHIPT